MTRGVHELKFRIAEKYKSLDARYELRQLDLEIRYGRDLAEFGDNNGYRPQM